MDVFETELKEKERECNRKAMILKDIDEVLTANPENIEDKDETEYRSLVAQIPLRTLRALPRLFIRNETRDELNRISHRLAQVGRLGTDQDMFCINFTNTSSSHEFHALINDELKAIQTLANTLDGTTEEKDETEVTNTSQTTETTATKQTQNRESVGTERTKGRNERILKLFDSLFGLTHAACLDFESWFTDTDELGRGVVSQICTKLGSLWTLALTKYSDSDLGLLKSAHVHRDREGVVALLERTKVSFASFGFAFDFDSVFVSQCVSTPANKKRRIVVSPEV